MKTILVHLDDSNVNDVALNNVVGDLDNNLFSIGATEVSTFELATDLLDEILEKTGRSVAFRSDGLIVTFDKYDGCDAHFSSSIDEAIEWEKGYLQDMSIDNISM